MRYAVGDRVVYPMHGAGVIEAVEERKVRGQAETYYVLHLPINDLRVYIPLRSVERVRLRPVIGSQELERLLHAASRRDATETESWNKRYRRNMDKMRTGDVYAVAQVVGSLTRREQRQGLSAGEHKMLELARRILLSEMVLATGLEEEQVDDMLARALG